MTGLKQVSSASLLRVPLTTLYGLTTTTVEIELLGTISPSLIILNSWNSPISLTATLWVQLSDFEIVRRKTQFDPAGLIIWKHSVVIESKIPLSTWQIVIRSRWPGLCEIPLKVYLGTEEKTSIPAVVIGSWLSDSGRLGNWNVRPTGDALVWLLSDQIWFFTSFFSSHFQ